ncbi:MAG: RNA polymerase sigma factor [Sphingosinicella sp.]|nr:RNA polymerase sigma factor [Sphingosinicella sp.]
MKNDGAPRRAPDTDALYRREATRLARFFRRRSGADEPQDLVHDAFVKLLSATRGRPVPERPAAYLQRIACNLLADSGRRAAVRGEMVPLQVDTAAMAYAPEQTHDIEVEDVRRQYRAAVDALPPRTREVFLLHRVDELTYRQIAERLGIGIRTVEWHIAEAQVRIGEALDRP